MACHILLRSAQHTDPLWLPDFGAFAAVFFFSLPTAASSPSKANTLKQYTQTAQVAKTCNAETRELQMTARICEHRGEREGVL